MTQIDPAAVKAAHAGDHRCIVNDRGQTGLGWYIPSHQGGPCEPYRLADSLEQARAELAAERTRVARVSAYVEDYAQFQVSGRDWNWIRRMRAALADQPKQVGHPVVFAGDMQHGPLYCATCRRTIVLDGYPERTDGDWIHLVDWQAKSPA